MMTFDGNELVEESEELKKEEDTGISADVAREVAGAEGKMPEERKW